MNAFVAKFESPVVEDYPSRTWPLHLADESATTKTLVRSDVEQFGIMFGASEAVGEALICGSRPGEWLILGDPEACIAATVEMIGFTSIIDHTHSKALFRLSGLLAASALEKVCSVDWSDSMTPDGAVVSGSVAKVSCDIIRNDAGGRPSYLLACDRSYGQYLFDALVDACHEFRRQDNPIIGKA